MMKKIISISLTFLMMTALLHLSVATHYCGGKVAASNISLTGKLATCGMENEEKDLPLASSSFTTHCCDNVLVFCGINSNYFPSFSFVPESYEQDFQVFSLPAGLAFKSIASIKSFYSNVNPPGVYLSNKVDLSSICVFRI